MAHDYNIYHGVIAILLDLSHLAGRLTNKHASGENSAL
ncbi:hypothetical protein AEST_30910 [Alishewanella aestuarii B11]|uniref:Uncharacterized protein n=1 Tax=Alishewanella aestuarii B11 TaxID=1197174 RepID=J2IAX4_9ALTE|nr:hypothetical protein AEST_30910 [Alishewanella aestuarii B11]